MARRHAHEEHANHEAWAIPYADLMTLLLAFFVVMYAISSLNEGKYRVMADALTTAFGGAPRTITQVQVGNVQLQGGGHDSPSVIRTPSMAGGAMADPTRLPSMASQMSQPVSLRDREQLQRAERQLSRIADRLNLSLAPLVDKGVINVRRTELWIEVEINSDILFPPGSATLDASARQTLGTLADVLQDVPNGVRVEGHTDNLPIESWLYPSNWELSSARASRVARLLIDQGVPRDRMRVEGLADTQPVSPNTDADGRPIPENQAQNRRVVILVSP